MANPDPQFQVSTQDSTSQQLLARQQAEKFEHLARNFSIAALIVCPTLALLPPRKVDFYTFALGGAFLYSADHLSTTYTHKGIWQHLSRPFDSRMRSMGPRSAQSQSAESGGSDVSEYTLPTARAQELHRQHKEKEARDKDLAGLTEDARRIRERKKGVLESVWMGEEKEGWKEKRLREEREKLEEGKGYGDLIMEQIWDVWNWGNKDGDEKKADGREKS